MEREPNEEGKPKTAESQIGRQCREPNRKKSSDPEGPRRSRSLSLSLQVFPLVDVSFFFMIAFFFFFFFFSSIPHRTPQPTPSTASATCLATAATPTRSSPPSITSSSTAILGTRNRVFWGFLWFLGIWGLWFVTEIECQKNLKK